MNHCQKNVNTRIPRTAHARPGDKEQVTHTLHLDEELGGQSKQTAEPLPPLTV